MIRLCWMCVKYRAAPPQAGPSLTPPYGGSISSKFQGIRSLSLPHPRRIRYYFDMHRRDAVKALAGAIPAAALAAKAAKFEPTFESLKQYRCPEWVRDAKFGIWAHWGPQCVPEVGDWDGRKLYIQDG